jgi:hypothetical protein
MFGVESHKLNFSSPPGDPFQPGGSGGQSNPFDPLAITDDSETGLPAGSDLINENPGLPDPLFPFLNIDNL